MTGFSLLRKSSGVTSVIKSGQPPRLPFGKTRGLSFENEFFQCSTTDKTYSAICATATVNGAPLT